LTVKEKVVMFITVYNTTPSTVTAQPLADCMFSYNLRSIMSLINPKSKVTINEKRNLVLILKIISIMRMRTVKFIFKK